MIPCQQDSYIKEWTCNVTKISGYNVEFDKTYFYPIGGGQQSDHGFLQLSNGNSVQVIECKKNSGEITHKVDDSSKLKVGDQVIAKLDWPRRYELMRMHTASHVLAAVIHDKTGALITGNKIDTGRSRMDFSIDDYTKDLLEQALAETNEHLVRGLETRSYEIDRDEALKDPSLVKLANVLPPSLKLLRVVEIGDVDKQLDGGTHVQNTKEVGQIVLEKVDNRGKYNRRIYFSLKEPKGA